MTDTANAPTGWSAPQAPDGPTPDDLSGWAAPDTAVAAGAEPVSGTSASGGAVEHDAWSGRDALTGASTATGSTPAPDPWSRDGAAAPPDEPALVSPPPPDPATGTAPPGPAGEPTTHPGRPGPAGEPTTLPARPGPAGEPAGRHPLDPDPARSTKAVAVLVLGVAAVLTGPLVGGLIPAGLAFVLGRQAYADIAAARGYLTGERQLRTGLTLAGIGVLLALAALVTALVIGIVDLVNGVGPDFPSTSD